MGEIIFEDLYKIISFEGFTFSRYNYIKEEQELLKPRLEELGFSEIEFEMGESDSFGPLSRFCTCVDAFGNKRAFIYA